MVGDVVTVDGNGRRGPFVVTSMLVQGKAPEVFVSGAQLLERNSEYEYDRLQWPSLLEADCGAFNFVEHWDLERTIAALAWDVPRRMMGHFSTIVRDNYKQPGRQL